MLLVLCAAIVVCEYVFGVAFTVDYLLHLFISENKMVYVFSWGAAVDLLAILPVFSINTDTSIGFLVRCCWRTHRCRACVQCMLRLMGGLSMPWLRLIPVCSACSECSVS